MCVKSRTDSFKAVSLFRAIDETLSKDGTDWDNALAGTTPMLIWGVEILLKLEY